MGWQLPPIFFLHIGLSLAMAGIAVTAYRHRDIAGAQPLALLAVCVAVWVGSNAGFILFSGFTGQLVFGNLIYLPIAVIPVVLVYFAEAYTGHDTFLTRYGPVPLLVVPALTQVFVWTNPSHHLFYATRSIDRSGAFVTLASTWGPLFWVHSAYSYVLIAIASYYLVRTLVVSDDIYSGQATALLIGVFTPWLSNALYLGGILAFPVDPTPIAFSITVVAFVVAIYRHRLLQMVPVARELARNELMDSLVEGVFILDDQERIVDCNERAATLIGGDHDLLVGESIAAVAPDIATKLDRLDAETDDTPVATEVAIRQDGRLRHYDVRVTRLRRGGGMLTGQLVSLRDVTERRQREQRLDVLNRTLRHDLRNEANVVLGYAELGQQQHPDAEWIEAIREHVAGMVDLSEKVRQIEQALDEEHVDITALDAVEVVERVVADVEEEHPDLHITTHLPETAPVRAIELLDAAVRNAVENAVEHNDNPDPLMDVAVRIACDGDTVSISVHDNGPGIHTDEQAVLLRGRETQLDPVSGLGLWMINWIVTKSGGETEIGENDPRGSIVTIRLPTAEEFDIPEGETRAQASDGGRSDARTADAAADESVADDATTAASSATPDGGSS